MEKCRAGAERDGEGNTQNYRRHRARQNNGRTEDRNNDGHCPRYARGTRGGAATYDRDRAKKDLKLNLQSSQVFIPSSNYKNRVGGGKTNDEQEQNSQSLGRASKPRARCDLIFIFGACKSYINLRTVSVLPCLCPTIKQGGRYSFNYLCMYRDRRPSLPLSFGRRGLKRSLINYERPNFLPRPTPNASARAPLSSIQSLGITKLKLEFVFASHCDYP